MERVTYRWSGGHLFLEVAGAVWLVDTGAPVSFGAREAFTLAGEVFQLSRHHRGLSVEALSGFVGVECAGLLGVDVLGRFDFLLDAPRGVATISTADLEHRGAIVELDDIMGVPIVSARVGGADHRMFLDTGAPLSYLQREALAAFPSAGRAADFHPSVGQFQTETHSVEVALAGVDFTLRCGVLPEALGASLLPTGIAGIIGSAVFADRVVGYFPRRRRLVL